MKPTILTASRSLLVLAFLLSAYLSWQALAPATAIAGCAEGASCSSVLTSPWAKLFGIPVALAGCLTYLAAAIPCNRSRFKGAHRAILLLIPAAAAWFIALQIFVIGSVCAWCCVTHAIASTGALLLLWGSNNAPRKEWFSASLSASVALAALALVQSLAATSTGDSPEDSSVVGVFDLDESGVGASNSRNEVVLLDGGLKFNLDELPMIGGARPQQVAIALTDYTCPHCRKLHATLERVGVGLDGKVAIMKLPATRLGTESAEIHSHMLAVWKVSRKAHWTLERSVIEERVPATSAAVMAEAVRLLGANQFAEASVEHTEWIREQIAKTRKLQDANRKKTGKGTLPQVMIGSELVLGAHSDPDYYVALAEREFGLVAASKSPVKSIELQSRAIEIDDGVIDLGNVKPGVDVPFRVAFTNSDQLPLQIKWVNMGAGITLEDFSRDEVAHERKAEISLFLKIPETLHQSQIARSVTVHTSSGHAPISFEVKATVGAGIASAQALSKDTLSSQN